MRVFDIFEKRDEETSTLEMMQYGTIRDGIAWSTNKYVASKTNGTGSNKNGQIYI